MDNDSNKLYVGGVLRKPTMIALYVPVKFYVIVFNLNKTIW